MDARYVAGYERLEREHWWWLARRRILLRLLDALTHSWPPDHRLALLDCGCGAGLNLAALRQRYDCQGIEPNLLLVERARKNSGVTVQLGSLPYGLPALDRQFDFITLLDVIEHIDDDVMTLKTAAGLLMPGGRIIINVPALPWLWSKHDVVNQHKRRYVAASLREVITRADLEVTLLRYWGALLVPLAWAERRMAVWHGKGTHEQAYEVKVPLPPVNALFYRLVRCEYALTDWLRPPLGLSLLAVAQAPHNPVS
jgi:2-polyprenyl-3-methyl-5-hydroxy-6-metoxy-1,4-benzoquinol methylase